MNYRRAIALCAALVAVLIATGGGLALAQQPEAAEVTFWNSVKDSKSAAEYKAYLSKFPNGTFADLAKLRVKALEAAAIAPAAAAPISPPPTAKPANFSTQIAPATPPPQAAAAPLNKWGALAFASNGANSSQWNHPTQALAEEAAIAACRRVSNNVRCEVASAIGSGCIALSYYRGQRNGKTYAGIYWATRSSLAEATSRSLELCRERSPVPSTCGVRNFVCADGSHKK